MASADVELIVREVMKRLAADSTAAPRTDAGHSPKTSPAPQKTNGQAKGSPRELALDSRLITLGMLEGRLEGIAQVRLPPRAVITPAARDLLTARGVAIGYAVPNSLPAKAKGLQQLVLGSAETKFEPAALVSQLRSGGIEVEQLARSGLTSVIDELASHAVQGGQPACLLIDEPHAALCIANRRLGLRAVWAPTADLAKRAIEGVGANLLIVTPGRSSVAALRSILELFVKQGPWHCPDALEQALERVLDDAGHACSCGPKH